MPMVNFDNQSTWDSQYSLSLPSDGSVRLGYHRVVLFASFEALAQAYVDQLGLTADSTVLIVGAGYAWSQEWLEAIAPGITVVSVDVSQKIQDDKDTTEQQEMAAALAQIGVAQGSPRWSSAMSRTPAQPRARRPVLASDVSSNAGQNEVRSAAGIKGKKKFDWVITEDAFPWLLDSECSALHASCLDLGDFVCHVVTDAQPTQSVGNWKSIEDWKQLFPDATIMSRHTQGIL